MRNHIYHVITPLSRIRNFAVLREMLEPHGIIWHLLIESGAVDCIEISTPWIYPYFFETKPGLLPFNCAINHFLDHWPLNDSDRYCFLADDDAYEYGFFDKIDAVEGEVLICTMMRGDRFPDGSPHPPGVLVAAPENMLRGMVGGEQIIFSGQAGREFRFGPEYSGDFDFMAAVTAKFPPAFVPGACVWFNYYEPGRWDKTSVAPSTTGA